MALLMVEARVLLEVKEIKDTLAPATTPPADEEIVPVTVTDVIKGVGVGMGIGDGVVIRVGIGVGTGVRVGTGVGLEVGSGVGLMVGEGMEVGPDGVRIYADLALKAERLPVLSTAWI